MKITKKLSLFLLAALTAPIFTSCESTDKVIDVPEISTGVYVLNQGKSKSNNASLTYYNLTSGATTADVFAAANNRGLGDTGQDIIKYGSRLYIAVYKSSLVEVVSAQTGVSIKSIPMLTGTTPAMPRSLAAANGKVYVTLYDGHVTELDTVSLATGRTVAVGSNPEQSVIVNNKLYVANSGGMAVKNDSTISVINLDNFTVGTPIKVVINPTVIKADKYGDLYVISMGNYYDIPYTLQRINTTTNVVTKITDVKAYNMTIDGDNAYIYHFEYNANWEIINKSYSVYDVKNEKLITSNFIPADALKQVPFSIDVNPVTKDVYIGETDYINTGKMYCYGADGKLKFSFATGVNPAKTIFISNK
jgi:hypothetical protein